MVQPRIQYSGACLSALLVVSCGSSAPLTDMAISAPPSVCTAPGYASDSSAIEIDEVDAQLRDPSGASVPNLLVQVCGLDVCVNGTTNIAGKTSVTPQVTLLRPAFKYGDGFLYAKLAAPLGPEARQDLGQLVALPLPDYADGAAFPRAGKASKITNGDVTLILAGGALISHDLLTYTEDSELVFRSVPIPLSDSARAADPSLGFELAYGLAPVSTTLCPAAELRVTNRLAWAANSAVEVFVQGLEVDEKWAPYGGWVKVADATVSLDGSSIQTTSGGIPILSSIALRRK